MTTWKEWKEKNTRWVAKEEVYGSPSLSNLSDARESYMVFYVSDLDVFLPQLLAEFYEEMQLQHTMHNLGYLGKKRFSAEDRKLIRKEQARRFLEEQK